MGSKYMTYEECQPAPGEPIDPRKIFQWINKIPFSGASPLIIQPEARPDFSQMLWDYGLRHMPDLQTEFPTLPFMGDVNSFNAATLNLKEGEEMPPKEFVQDPMSMTDEGRARQIELYRSHGLLPDVPAGDEYASVDHVGSFQPGNESPGVVKGYLMACSDVERRRVLGLEQNGKKRMSILRAFPGE